MSVKQVQQTDIVRHLGALGGGYPLRPALVVTKGQHAGASFALDSYPVVIGREEDCTIILEDHGISRYHCRLIEERGDVFVEDLGSTNGTFVNQDEIRRAPLRDGDRLRLGQQTVIKFTRQDADEEAHQRQLYEAAVKDPLTGLYNRRYFMERLSSELAFALRHLTYLSLLVLDIDHFSTFNANHGSDAGDDVLRQLARLLVSASREEDVFARVGGEEFAIVTRGIKRRQTFEFAERLRQIVADHTFKSDEGDHRITVSVGTYCVAPPVGRLQIKELVRHADDALSHAKDGGRNLVFPGIPEAIVSQRNTLL